MPDFSVILGTPEVRKIVQEGALERAFHDALFPNVLFRADAVPMPWPAGVGDTYIASAPGLIPPVMAPLTPGRDPEPVSYPMEQWEAQVQQYASTIDTHMPTSIVAIVDLFMRNAHQLGMQAAQTMNRIVRNKMYNAAESGWTVANGAGVASTSLTVKNIAGFTRARSASGSKVRFDTVSSSNPLSITVGGTAASVIACTPTNTGSEVGPGVLTLASGISWSDRDYVKAIDATELVRVGGGNSVGSIGTTDLPGLADIRSAVAIFRRNNAPVHPDGHFHAHLDPDSEAMILGDPELQRLMTGVPDHFTYQEFALGRMLGVIFLRNNECPIPQTVYPYDGTTFSVNDNFGGELYSDGTISGTPIHRILLSAMGGIYEYRMDMSGLLTEAGMVGRSGDVHVVNNGVDITADGVQLIVRAPLNRLQDQVSTSWKFMGDWPCRTDACTGGPGRYKRFSLIQHGQA